MQVVLIVLLAFVLLGSPTGGARPLPGARPVPPQGVQQKPSAADQFLAGAGAALGGLARSLASSSSSSAAFMPDTSLATSDARSNNPTAEDLVGFDTNNYSTSSGFEFTDDSGSFIAG